MIQYQVVRLQSKCFFEPIEILEVSAIAEVKKMIEDCMQPLPMPDSGLNLPLKEESEKFEAKQIKDAIDNHLSPETKKELRTKKTAIRTDFMTRKKLAAESSKAACHLPPLAPKKDNGKKTSDKMQLPQEGKGSIELKQDSKSPQVHIVISTLFLNHQFSINLCIHCVNLCINCANLCTTGLVISTSLPINFLNCIFFNRAMKIKKMKHLQHHQQRQG